MTGSALNAVTCTLTARGTSPAWTTRIVGSSPTLDRIMVWLPRWRTSTRTGGDLATPRTGGDDDANSEAKCHGHHEWGQNATLARLAGRRGRDLNRPCGGC